MRDLNERSITSAAIEQLSDAPDPRVREISEALVRHLHDFVREVELTPEEWMAGIRFLTRTGQTCDATRQEFILLSDALGVSMLVDMVAHRRDDPDVTVSTVLGPFYVDETPILPLGSDIADDADGPPLLVAGRVLSEEGGAIEDASVEVWQSNSEGYYDVQLGDQLNLRAQFRTDEGGHYRFWSVVPSDYPIPDDGPVGEMLRAQGRHPNRPAHVHFKISAPGHEELVTHLFIDGDPYLDSDVVFGVRSPLIVTLVERTADNAIPGDAPEKAADGYAELAYDFVLPRHA